MRRRIPSFRLPRRPWQAFLLGVLVVVLAALQQWRPELFQHSGQQQAALQDIEPGTYRVARVVDGDTIVLVERKEHVRLIGANTPETVKQNWPVEPWGPEASAFTREFLSGGNVRLEFDGDRRDKYNRILAYVWVGNRMLNEELIRAGLARAETQYHYSAAMKARFRRAEAAAKSEQRGIWSTEGATADKRK
jgi:micrococcal nuclease